MNTDKNKIPTKIISLILVQVFLVTGLCCPEPAKSINNIPSLYIVRMFDKQRNSASLRVPMENSRERMAGIYNSLIFTQGAVEHGWKNILSAKSLKEQLDKMMPEELEIFIKEYSDEEVAVQVRVFQKSVLGYARQALSKSRASIAIKNNIQEASQLIEEGRAAEAIPLLEVITAVLKLQSSSGRIAQNYRGDLLYILKLASSDTAAANLANALGLEGFLEKYVTKTSPAEYYFIPTDDLFFNVLFLDQQKQEEAAALLAKAYRIAGIKSFVTAVQCRKEETVDINGGTVQTELLAYHMAALGAVGVNALLDMDDTDQEILRRIIWLLGQSHDYFAAGILLQKIHSFKTQDGATQADSHFLDNATLSTADWVIAVQLIYALAENRDENTVDGLLPVFKYPVAHISHVKLALIEAVYKFKTIQALPILNGILKDKAEDFYMRVHAAKIAVDIIQGIEIEKREKDPIVADTTDGLAFLLETACSQRVFFGTALLLELWKIDTQKSRELTSRILGDTVKISDDTLRLLIHRGVISESPESIEILEFIKRAEILPKLFFEDGAQVSFKDWRYAALGSPSRWMREDMILHRTDERLIAVSTDKGFKIISPDRIDLACDTMRPILRGIG